jgi:hypothetical protein
MAEAETMTAMPSPYWADPDALASGQPISRIDHKKRDKVAIIGFAPSRVLAPFADDSFDIWGINDLWFAMNGPECRWDRWFDIHNDKVLHNNPRTGEKHWEWLKRVNDMPVYMLKKYDEVPASVKFPLEELVEHFSDDEGFSGDYFTNSISFMIALAVYEAYSEIHVYGVNMLGSDEYEYQRPCVEYWVGFAKGRGIKCVIPKESSLLKADKRYGYETHTGGETDMIRLLQDRLTAHEGKLNQAILAQREVAGACEALRYGIEMLKHQARGGVLPDMPSTATPGSNSAPPNETAALRQQIAAMEEKLKAIAGEGV